MFLLDTNVVSAARKRKGSVADWLVRQDRQSFFLSVITLGEIARGIEMKRRNDSDAANHLATWFHGLRHSYENRILDIDEKIAAEWGRISALRTRGDADGLIAATALVHDLILVTRNVADFNDTGVTIFNPWESSS
ncbi:type II toxin-antitoxin system VapC family toxin [Mesorhizobium sp. VK9D]|uniref:type II toxin-antitoxin system VapC family toxin n=1 Tax=Mesorhizobium australafricanum TaxID=3072311 RepID=UPI002A23CF67|nr:type II toxin-antitoxin system VapC family toxin [Mesorhizobium sp. VK9D]MDX8453471.1 type II toxin-antitoxin system VapC family toxin [Mesorhizobium sp. VK9D]